MECFAFTFLLWLPMLRTLATATVLSNRTDVLEPTTNEDNISQEYCTGETFRPRCSGGKNDIIVILTARYGRMSFGRCLVENPGFASMANNPLFVGCSDDVKHILDQQCSGLSECDVRIIDQNFAGIQPCYNGLKMHLEASFMCLKVATESRHCTVPLTTEPQHIVGGARSRQIQTEAVGCGTESQPWSIEALSGQRIAVSLIEFESTASVSSTQVSSCHPVYGRIVDKHSRTNKSICGNPRSLHEQRATQKTLHVSKSNQLQIITNSETAGKYILRIGAVGCSDLAPPSDSAWLKRVDDQITVGCYMSRQSWKLTCVNGVWTGTVGVCKEIDTEHPASKVQDLENSTRNLKSGHSSLTEMTALVAVASAGVAVCCMVICIGVVCLRRQQRQLKKCGKSAPNVQAEQFKYQDKDVINTSLLMQTNA